MRPVAFAFVTPCMACGSAPSPADEGTTSTTSASDSSTSVQDAGTTTVAEESSSTSAPPACDLEGAIDREELLADLASLHEIAEEHGNRSIITQGHYASAEWIAGELEAVGYEVVRQPVEFSHYGWSEDPRLATTGPNAVEYVAWEDFGHATSSPPGEVTGPARVVDAQLGLGNASTSGCESDDFADFVAGEIAVLQAGGCWPTHKVANAQAAGAAAVVLFNQGDVPERNEGFAIYLSDAITIPVILADYAVGEALAGHPNGELTLDFAVSTSASKGPSTYNVLAQSDGDAEHVIVIGAHLDTVSAGAGINDNGSGSVALLALARALASCEPRNRVLFAWWSAEEVGIWGSREFVEWIGPKQRDAIDLYVNLDMLASTNHVPFVLDGDGSRSSFAPSRGSEAIEVELVDYFAERGIVVAETEADSPSDHVPFAEYGIPVTHLYTGAGEEKTAKQAARYGGQAGAQLDPCYHLACDDLDNVDTDIFVTMSRAAAYLVGRHAL